MYSQFSGIPLKTFFPGRGQLQDAEVNAEVNRAQNLLREPCGRASRTVQARMLMVEVDKPVSICKGFFNSPFVVNTLPV